MLLNVFCKQGKLQVLEEGILRVMAPFNNLVWQVPCANVTGFTTQPSTLGAVIVAIHTTQGTQYVETVSIHNAKKLQTLFPNLSSNEVQGKEWYHSIQAMTHVAIYTKQRQMQKEVETSAHFGWMPQNTAAQNGKFSAGKALAGGVLLGPFGLLAGAVGNKNKITITFVRTPQWITQNT